MSGNSPSPPSFVHVKCRNSTVPYPRSDGVFRFAVPDTKVAWHVAWEEYAPRDYTNPATAGRPWADAEIGQGDGHFQWNKEDNGVNRQSHMGKYDVVSGRPRNPMGRTGLMGRGVLGRWGPNHAADPIISRIRDGHLEFVAIERRDCGEWAIPGGMVDPGEQVENTLLREFSEEALDGASMPAMLAARAHELYRGYVDDPRNTDNAWMETVAVNFHDDAGLMDEVPLRGGSDARHARWVRVDDPELRLYASHERLIAMLAQRHHYDK